MNIADEILERLDAARKLSKNVHIILTNEQIRALCSAAIDTIKREPILLNLESPIRVFGDIHGQFYDLLRLIPNHADLKTQKFLFLGDYVDRGNNSVETISYLLALKVKYPKNIWLLRGNHETEDMSEEYGFWNEIYLFYRNTEIWQQFLNVFNWLPLCATIGKKIFCVHGGISPDLHNVNELYNYYRPLTIPDEGVLADLLWSDPSRKKNGWTESKRGVSYYYGKDVTDSFLKKNGFTMILRGHEQVENGYDFPFSPDNSVLTVFSAPGYEEEEDDAATLFVDEKMNFSFTVYSSTN